MMKADSVSQKSREQPLSLSEAVHVVCENVSKTSPYHDGHNSYQTFSYALAIEDSASGVLRRGRWS